MSVIRSPIRSIWGMSPVRPATVLYSGRDFGWYPNRLFQSGDVLLWYDPSDLTTMFQDVAGTSPVTADDQSVALMLDKGQWGGKTLAQVLAGQAELAAPFDFTDGWTLAGAANISTGTATFTRSDIGGLFKSYFEVGKYYRIDCDLTVTDTTARLVNTGGSGSEAQWIFGESLTTGVYSRIWLAGATELYFRLAGAGSLTVNSISIKEIPGYHRTQATAASMPKYKTGPNPAAAEASAETILNGGFDADANWTKGTGWAIAAGVATKTPGSAAQLAQPATPVVGATYRVTFTVSGRTAGGVYPMFSGGTNAFGSTVVTNGTFTQFITAASGNNTFRFVTDSTFDGSIDNVSVKLVPASAPYIHWLLYDGTDDSNATPSINWGTDEVAACVGLRKVSDVAAAVAFELSVTSSTNNGTFALFAPGSATPNYLWRTKGTADSLMNRNPFTAPTTNVVTGMGKISTDINRGRVDAAELTTAADQGTGNFGSHVLYFGRRGGSSLPFNGREHQTIIRSRLLSASELAKLETFVAAKTGVIL